MAVIHSTVTVGTAPTKLVDPGVRGFDNEQGGILENISTADVFVGQSDVAVSGARRGYKLPAGGKLEFSLGHEDELYGVVAAGTADVVVLKTEG